MEISPAYLFREQFRWDSWRLEIVKKCKMFDFDN